MQTIKPVLSGSIQFSALPQKTSVFIPSLPQTVITQPVERPLTPPTKKKYQDPHIAALLQTKQDEKILWVGGSSQIINFSTFFWCFFTFWLIIPIFVALIAWLDVKYRRYALTTERLRILSGFITRRIEDLELYRVKDTTYVQPFFYKFFGLGNVNLSTSDPTSPVVAIQAIPNALLLREEVRDAVEVARDKKGVKEIDYYQHH